MIKVLDLFAGAGGLSLGFEMTNKYLSVGMIENNLMATKTYQENRLHKIDTFKDITKIDKGVLKDKFNNIDVIIGGPPCQGFSNANRQHRHLINGNNELVKKYIDTVLDLNPKTFVMENVPSIQSSTHKFFCNATEAANQMYSNVRKNEKIMVYESIDENTLLELVNVATYSEANLLLIDEIIHLLRVMLRNLRRKNIKKLEETIVKLRKMTITVDFINLQIESINIDLTALNADSDSPIITEVSNKVQNVITKLTAKRLMFELEKYQIDYYFIIENNRLYANVKTIGIIDYVMANLSSIYDLQYDVLNAHEFGVPQNRRRFFMIGINKSLKTNFKISMIQRSNNFPTVRDAIEDLEEITPFYTNEDKDIYIQDYNGSIKRIFNHVTTNTTANALRMFKHLQPGQNFHNLDESLKSTYSNPEKTQNSIYLRLDYDLPSSTVMNVRKSMWIHPVLHRGISVREAARLQSFPDTYKFFGTKDMMYQQIGNAVPPLLAKSIATALYEHVFRFQSKN